jgi:hypothetical protein
MTTFYNLEKIESIGVLFNFLEKTKGVTQDSKHHPEGDVFNHCLQTLFISLKETYDIDLIIAAMLHDVGKTIHTNGHARYSVDLLKGKITPKTEWLIFNHMRFWELVLGNMKRKFKVAALIDNKWFADLALLARWDKMGRNKNKVITYDRVEIINKIKDNQRKKGL